LMAKLHSEVLEEATNKIRQNEVLEARVRELSEKLRWSEAERVQLEEEHVREAQEHAALKKEYRALKNMMVDNISVSEPRRGPLLPAHSAAPLHGAPERSER